MIKLIYLPDILIQKIGSLYKFKNAIESQFLETELKFRILKIRGFFYVIKCP